MRRYYICVIVLTLLGAVACGGDNAKSDELPQFVPFDITVENEMLDLHICYQRIANADKDPIFASIEAQNYANSFDGYTVEPMSVEASAQLLADDYTEEDAELHDIILPRYKYVMDQEVHFERNRSILCYETYIEIYTGGPHEGHSLWYECFDLATGQLYDFDYLFEGEWGDAIRRIIYAKLNDVEPDNLIENVDVIPIADSVLITSRGLTLVYQPYAVASFAQGIISLDLSDEEIAATGAPLVWVDEE